MGYRSYAFWVIWIYGTHFNSWRVSVLVGVDGAFVSGSGIAYSLALAFLAFSALALAFGIEILLRSRGYLWWHSVCTLSGDLANFTALKKARALGSLASRLNQPERVSNEQKSKGRTENYRERKRINSTEKCTLQT